MKRIFAFFVAAMLMLPYFLPLQASATDIDISDYNQHITLAKKVFPEYTDRLDRRVASRSINPECEDSELVIAVRETRSVDKSTTMTYTEYSNGIVTLGTVSYETTKELYVEDSEVFGSYTQYTAKIVASVKEGPTFTATNVQYRIYPSTYDEILNIGRYSIPGYSNDKFSTYLRSTETASLSACAVYSFPCPVGSSSYSGEVSLELRNNVASVEFDIW